MSLFDAIVRTGPLPPDTATQAQKKRYSEILSAQLAIEVAEGLRAAGFPNVKPVYSITLEKLSRPRRFFEGKTIMGKTIKNTNDG
jgi:hypothetical protein